MCHETTQEKGRSHRTIFWGKIGGLIMVVVSMILILLRGYFDNRMHPRMDTALKIVRSCAEVFYVYTVPRMEHRSL